MDGFLIENRLKEGSPELHRRFRDSVLVLDMILSKYLTRFPTFTDHSMLHSLTVLDYCNSIIGEDQVGMLSPEECYVVCMACYLHDSGMGVNDKDYEEFSAQIDFGDYFEGHDRNNVPNTLRAFHNDFSGAFIRKYAPLFDIPTEAITEAVVQISRGHRKTNLIDSAEYDDIYDGDVRIRIAYLAAVVRLADEIDVASERNPELLFDPSTIDDEVSLMHFRLHKSIIRVEVTEDAILLHAKPVTQHYNKLIDELAEKIQGTLDYCRAAAEAKSDLKIRQEKVKIVFAK